MIAVYTPKRPTNVYLAFHGVDYQVEVFHAHPGQAQKLAVMGALVPIE